MLIIDLEKRHWRERGGPANLRGTSINSDGLTADEYVHYAITERNATLPLKAEDFVAFQFAHACECVHCRYGQTKRGEYTFTRERQSRALVPC